ncbi:Zinc finger, PHD-type [Corchorus capsularis]|uniref:PHD finger protein ALFIN-LIKE n=1 Tax=Corchorus capsularis TaxID=210143 RepID=A0A1R3HK06_COCAP|nr:Zinc finger, PHD-type [Corchorus capsularis]
MKFDRLTRKPDFPLHFQYSVYALDYESGNRSQSIHTQPKDEDEGLDEEEHGETLCGACGENYASDEFWICCDVCNEWFHGKFVKITPARAEHIEHYKCPSCCNKERARP